MECSVCYSDTANCNLTCGHSFCFSCVKAWYHKCSEPTCPMCRKSLNFRGLRRLEEKWNEDARVQKIDDLFGEFIDEALDGCDWLDFVMIEIEEAQKRLIQIDGWEFERDIFEAVMYDTINLVTSSDLRAYDEPRTFEHTLFAPKSPIRQENPSNSMCAREFSSATSDIFDILIIV